MTCRVVPRGRWLRQLGRGLNGRWIPANESNQVLAGITHICSSGTIEHQHPLSYHVISVLRAEEASVDGFALTLAVAVEGIVKSAFPDQVAPASEDISQIDAALTLISVSDLRNDIKNKIENRLSAMKARLSVRPIDKLYALARRGAVREKLIGVWKSLRNAAAHADLSAPEEVAKRHQQCQIVRMLLHELIFEAIGYEGEFTDYSVFGWPIATRQNQAAIATAQ